MYVPMTRKSRPMKLAGVQFASPILPPGLHTRSSSEAAFSWSGVNITPKVESTASNDASAKGRFSASASRNAISRPSAAARWRAWSRSAGT
jgi:hypothetical protein